MTRYRDEQETRERVEERLRTDPTIPMDRERARREAEASVSRVVRDIERREQQGERERRRG